MHIRLNALQGSASKHQPTPDHPHPLQDCCLPLGCFLPLQWHPAAWECAVTGLQVAHMVAAVPLQSPYPYMHGGRCGKQLSPFPGIGGCVQDAPTSVCQECSSNALGHSSHRRGPALAFSLHSAIF